MVGGDSEEVLGHDMRASAHRDEGAVGDLRAVGGHVTGRVADAEHQHPLAGVGLRLPVVVRVELLAGEGIGPGEGRGRQPRVPVVAVRHQHGVVPAGALFAAVAMPRGNVPRAVGATLDPGDLGAELDVLAEAEVLDVVVEVGGDGSVAKIVRVVARHFERGVLHAVPR